MRLKRLTPKVTLLLVLVALHLAPIWLFTYFPTQDGSSHIYNAYVLKEYHKHQNYRLREVYTLNLLLFPNWSSQIIMTAFMHIVPPIVCEKIVISLSIGLLPLAFLYFFIRYRPTTDELRVRVGRFCFYLSLSASHGFLQLLAQYAHVFLQPWFLVATQNQPHPASPWYSIPVSNFDLSLSFPILLAVGGGHDLFCHLHPSLPSLN